MAWKHISGQHLQAWVQVMVPITSIEAGYLSELLSHVSFALGAVQSVKGGLSGILAPLWILGVPRRAGVHFTVHLIKDALKDTRRCQYSARHYYEMD